MAEKSVLVIGGGISGIQAALDLGDRGFKVYLVEREPSIGGRMAQLDKTFPTMDCSACILTPKMVDVSRHPNIELLTYSEVLEVKKASSDFRVKVLCKPRYVDGEKCTGCAKCADYCPIETTNEFDMGLGVRKAIYVPFPQAVPLVFTIDEDRCIKCGLCKNVCEPDAINLEDKQRELELQVGSIIVATGFKTFDASRKGEYGYGIYANVITALEFERLINASGPLGGHLVRLSDGKIPKKVAFVQCVGSRDKEVGNPYCSRVCCMYAIKNARLLKEHYPDCDVTIFYIDIRSFGKGFEEFYRRTEDEFKVRFVRGRVSSIWEDPKSENLLIRAEDIETGENIEEEFDMVVLSVGLVPPDGSEELAELLGLPVATDGFLKESDANFNPMGTGVENIFIAGVSQGPKDIPDSVAQASGAATKASIFMKKVR